jgi:sulfur-carrier protein adenylyltransferase/sulfurtransferase
MPTYKTGADLIADAQSRVTEVSPRDAIAQHGQDVIFLDVREPSEWNMGRVAGALHVPRGQLEVKIEGLIDRSKHIVIYCAAGSRSALAADTMRQMGYEHVTSLRDGFRGWAEAGGAIED